MTATGKRNLFMEKSFRARWRSGRAPWGPTRREAHARGLARWRPCEEEGIESCAANVAASSQLSASRVSERSCSRRLELARFLAEEDGGLPFGSVAVDRVDVARLQRDIERGSKGALAQHGRALSVTGVLLSRVMNPQELSTTLSGMATNGRGEWRMRVSLGEIRWMAAGFESPIRRRHVQYPGRSHEDITEEEGGCAGQQGHRQQDEHLRVGAD